MATFSQDERKGEILSWKRGVSGADYQGDVDQNTIPGYDIHASNMIVKPKYTKSQGTAGKNKS